MRIGSDDPLDLGNPSFSALLRRAHPEGTLPSPTEKQPLEHVEGTTVLAVTFADGVVIAGDRRATAGNIISKRDMRKVFQADAYSAVAISGVAGPAMELARVFATELEHYEKVEGGPLSLQGKANKLAQMVRGNLSLAMQGLVVVPLFAGWDERAGQGRIYEYDPAGGLYAEERFATSGSGGRDARGSLKARWTEGLDRQETIDIVVEALWDAADEDSATGGPDVVRGIYPLVVVIDEAGYGELDDAEVAARVEEVVAARR